MLCGVDEAIALLHTFAKNTENLEILALKDGDVIKANEPVLKVTGKYEDFGYLESVIDGILARRTSVATNVMEVLEVAKDTPVFSMADRQDDCRRARRRGFWRKSHRQAFIRSEKSFSGVSGFSPRNLRLPT